VNLSSVDAHIPAGTDGVPRQLSALENSGDGVLDSVAVATSDRDVGIADAQLGVIEARHEKVIGGRWGADEYRGVGSQVVDVAQDASSARRSEVVVDDLDDSRPAGRQGSMQPVTADALGVASESGHGGGDGGNIDPSTTSCSQDPHG